MDIRTRRMVHLGYGKYWRSDHIVGLLPIEEERGPGRRTEVYVETRPEPIIASRTENSLLEDMAAAPGGGSREARLQEAVIDLRGVLESLSPVVRRMLRSEGNLDVQAWIRRIEELVAGDDADDGQEDLFQGL